jgi:N-acetylneuraminate synthase|tara:strand:- start:14 stop:1054 length:1041 start_codon:yes stop_codon:yes gene_type:complete
MKHAVTINDHLVGTNQPPFIIAEACINHEGDINIAKQMVHMAHAMGSDCIKFQIHVLDNEMLRETPQSDNFEEPLWDTLERTNLTLDEHIKLMELCNNLGILYLCTPFSKEGTDILEDIGVDFYKTGSGEMTNLPLIEYIAKKGKPMIISTGMSNIDEVQETVDLVKSIGTPLIITHCTSAYPCPYNRINLGMIPKYQQRFGIPIGLSDHSMGIYTSLGAVAMGAAVIEKHFTLDKMQKGPDHPSSIEPYELGELVKGTRAIFEARGSEKKIYDEEKQIIAWARESVVTEMDIKAGEIISKEMVWVKRPGPGPNVVPAKNLKKVIGSKAVRDIPKDTQVKWKDLSE